MIIKINKAIIEKIKKAISLSTLKKVDVAPEDLAEPIRRPSLKVAIEDIKQSFINPLCINNELTVRIYFYAKDGNRPKLDNLAMQGVLFDAFRENIISDDFCIEVSEIKIVTTDGVLVVSFDIRYLEKLPQKPLEETDTLSMSIKEEI